GHREVVERRAAAFVETPPAGGAAEGAVAQAGLLLLLLGLRQSAVRARHGRTPFLLFRALLSPAYPDHSPPASPAPPPDGTIIATVEQRDVPRTDFTARTPVAQAGLLGLLLGLR